MYNSDKKWFLSQLSNKSLLNKLSKIKLIITDVDGCLTNGKGYYSDHKEIQKNFSIQDGYLITKCNKPGMPHIAWVTGRSDAAATNRAKTLSIPDELYYQGVNKDKSTIVREILQKLSVTKEETLFFGDDVLDLQVRDEVEILAAPSSALFYVKDHADIVSPRIGGDGAFRLILDLTLYVQKLHIAQDFIERSLNTQTHE